MAAPPWLIPFAAVAVPGLIYATVGLWALRTAPTHGVEPERTRAASRFRGVLTLGLALIVVERGIAAAVEGDNFMLFLGAMLAPFLAVFGCQFLFGADQLVEAFKNPEGAEARANRSGAGWGFIVTGILLIVLGVMLGGFQAGTRSS